VDNPFILPLDEYKRDVNPLADYFDQSSIYLSRQLGIPLLEAQAYIKAQLAPGGRFEYKEPQARYLQRNDYGDRELKVSPLSVYIAESLKADEPIAATFTTYHPVKKCKSVLAEYIEENAKIRKKMKGEMIQAKVLTNQLRAAADNLKTAMDLVGAEAKYKESRVMKALTELRNVAQKYAKQKNNSLSGTAASTSTSFLNPSAHSTLTSTTRSASSYANANNERFLTGTRHYWSIHIALNAMTATMGRCDEAETLRVIAQYNLHVPSAQDVVDCIEWSSRFYWPNSDKMKVIEQYAARMSPAERTMFVYTGDLYHLKKHNPALVHRLLTGLTAIPVMDVDHPAALFKAASGPIKILANQVCAEHTMGLGLNDIPSHPAALAQVARSISSIGATLEWCADLIRLFVTTSLLPGSMANFTSAVRRTVIMSDTDSTIFTVEKWVEWYTGEFRITPHGRQVGAAMTFLVEATTQHILSTMAVNMGVAKDMLSSIEMKNEYAFEVFASTTSKKHYYGLKTVLEGEQLKTPELEIKGVGLISSTVPKVVMTQVKGIMEKVLMTVHAGKLLSLRELLQDAAKIELQLKHDISHGSPEYFKLVKVKSHSTYKHGEANPTFQQHLFWDTIFGPKYGMAPPLPYSSVKISLGLKNRTALINWADGFTDVVTRSELKRWLTTKGKTSFKVLHIPSATMNAKGFPDEVKQVVNIDKMIYDMTAPTYMAFQALGIHMGSSKMFYHVYEDTPLVRDPPHADAVAA
jgi:hypothetical protein